MRRAFPVLPLLLLLTILALSTSLKIVVSASSNVIYVPEDFPTIQRAIDNATAGSIIIVNGTYREDITIEKSLSLFGIDSSSAEIQGMSRYVVRIEADNVHIKNFTITKATTDLEDIGIRMSSSNNNTIENNKIININTGIFLSLSNNNTISSNLISNKQNADNGISLYRSRNNFFADNSILNNTIGALISTFSIDNVFSGNTFINSSPEVSLYSSSGNVFYHNNFNGSVQVTEGFSNYWSRNNEGNYWGSYVVSDSNNDGIGDQPYIIDQYNHDSFPLVGRFFGYTATLKGKNYDVAVISNSSVKDFSFDIGKETGNKIVTFNVSDEGDAIRFCRVMVPTEIMSFPYVVVVGGEEIVPSLLSFSNETVSFLYFTYVDGNQTISVISSKTLYLYYDLLDKYVALQASLSDLNVSYYQLSNNYSLLLGNFTQLQNQYSALSYSRYVENMQNLVYVFAFTTAVFLMTTIYLSRRAAPRNRSHD